MNQRYLKNLQAISESEQEQLLNKRISIVGCGGLGQYIASLLCRIGVGSLKIIDHDMFEETNLNRQLFCNVENIGKSKVLETEKQLRLINPDVMLTVYQERFSEVNANDFLDGADVVLDALDSIRDRLILQKYCNDLRIPLVTAAIGGWYGHLTIVQPGDDTLSKMYPNPDTKGVETKLGNPAFTPCLVAALQVNETVKLLLGKSKLERGEILYVDLLNLMFDTYNL